MSVLQQTQYTCMQRNSIAVSVVRCIEAHNKRSKTIVGCIIILKLLLTHILLLFVYNSKQLNSSFLLFSIRHCFCSFRRCLFLYCGLYARKGFKFRLFFVLNARFGRTSFHCTICHLFIDLFFAFCVFWKTKRVNFA